MSEIITLCPYEHKGKTYYTSNCCKKDPGCETKHFEVEIGLTLDQYQNRTSKTALFPKGRVMADGRMFDVGLLYTILGLCGEAGEVSENVKKMIRDDNGKITDERMGKLIKELGDVLWYLAQAAVQLGIPLSQIAQGNLDKLTKRLEEGKIHGSGSER